MSEKLYSPSLTGWVVLAHGHTTLAIDLKAAEERIAGLWELVRVDATPGRILDEIIRSGLSAAPSFMLIGGSSESGATVLVRGSGVLRVHGRAGELEISGGGVSSWVEQVLDMSQGYEFRVPTARTDGEFLPFESAVVRGGIVRSGSYIGASKSSTPAAVEMPMPMPTLAPAAAPGEMRPGGAESAAPRPTQIDDVVDVEVTIAAETTTFAPAPLTPAPAQPSVTSDSEVSPSSYDHLFGETVLRNVEDAAVREIESSVVVGPPPPGPAPDVDGGDHDGHTVMVADLAGLRAKRRAAKAAATAPEPASPNLYLELSTGGREQLDQPLVIGRAPSASRVPGGSIPRLVSMNTPNQDISRTHAQISAEGGTVVVTDLHSSNGTTITMPGKSAQKLRPGEPSAVIIGTVIDLGDGATLTVCESL